MAQWYLYNKKLDIFRIVKKTIFTKDLTVIKDLFDYKRLVYVLRLLRLPKTTIQSIKYSGQGHRKPSKASITLCVFKKKFK